MAFQTGSQLRPELSAVNYTPFLQAAGQAAQMQLQGNAALAKGLEDVAGKVTKAIQERQAQDEAVQLVKSLYPGIDDKTALYGVKSAGGGTAFIKFKTDFDRYQKSTTDQAKAAEYAQNLLSGKGVATTEGLTPEQVTAGRNIYLDFLKTEAGVQKTTAEAEATKALGKAREAETLAKTRDDTIISSVIKDLTTDQGVPSMLRRAGKQPMSPQDVITNAAKMGISAEGLGRVSNVASALVRTREAGFDNPNDAVASVPKESLPVGYEILPEQDRKSGKWFGVPTKSAALSSLGSDYTMVKDPNGVPVAKVIPGSATEQKLNDKAKKEKESVETFNYHVASDRDKVLRALWLLNHESRTGFAAITGTLGPLSGEKTQEYVRLIDSIRSASGINYLMQLKQSSPTGGGPLGTTSDKDFSAVIDSVAPYRALDKEENVRRGLMNTLGLLNNLASKEGGIGRLEYKDYEAGQMKRNFEEKQAAGAIPVSSSDVYLKMHLRGIK